MSLQLDFHLSLALCVCIFVACIGFLLWCAYDYGYDKGWNNGHNGMVEAYEAAEEEF